MIVRFLDGIINLLRWPTAFLLILLLPALVESYRHFNFMTPKFYFLAAGVAFFVFTAFVGGYNIRESMQIIAHELTHTVFAILTFHRVGKIRLNPDGSGGSMQLKGKGNWLISLSPYFFPLFAFLFMLIMPWLLRVCAKSWIIYVILGYFLAYYWATVLSQTHIHQTDIINEGYVFSGIIIVAANLLVTGCILAFTSKLWDGVRIYVLFIEKLTRDNFSAVSALIMPYFQQ